MKFMSFNLRLDIEWDGINSFTNRFSRVIEVIKNEAPDVIGFQEVTDSRRSRLRNELDGYTTVGCGREKNYHGESMLIAYRTDTFELISCENVWLSATPKIPGSTYGGDQSQCPRMYTSILLKHEKTEKPFRFINTHLDHVGEQARYLGSMQLVQAISGYDENAIIGNRMLIMFFIFQSQETKKRSICILIILKKKVIPKKR